METDMERNKETLSKDFPFNDSFFTFLNEKNYVYLFDEIFRTWSITKLVVSCHSQTRMGIIVTCRGTT